MAQLARIGGRLLPLNDWEGDDFVPGSGGRYVTCMDTATGRACAFATNGRVDLDGQTYRRAIKPPDPNGVNFYQMAEAVKRINPHLSLIHSTGWTRGAATSWLKARKGLIVTGTYSSIPRAYRHQGGAGTFAHAMFVSHFSQDGRMMRLYDPLDPNEKLRGRSVPSSILWPFLDDLDGNAGYIPLHPLTLP